MSSSRSPQGGVPRRQRVPGLCGTSRAAQWGGMGLGEGGGDEGGGRGGGGCKEGRRGEEAGSGREGKGGEPGAVS